MPMGGISLTDRARLHVFLDVLSHTVPLELPLQELHRFLDAPVASARFVMMQPQELVHKTPLIRHHQSALVQQRSVVCTAIMRSCGLTLIEVFYHPLTERVLFLDSCNQLPQALRGFLPWRFILDCLSSPSTCHCLYQYASNEVISLNLILRCHGELLRARATCPGVPSPPFG
jgi:hypothetical protein